MKRKQFLAILLSMSMGVASAAPVAYAEEEVPAVESAQTQETQAETQAETAELSAVDVQPETPAEMQAQENAADQSETSAPQTEVSGQSETTSADTGAADNASGQSERDGEKKDSKQGNQKSASDKTVGGGRTENNFLKIQKTSAKYSDGEIIVEVVTDQTDYDALFFGEKGTQNWDDAIEGELTEDKSGYIFRFAITAEQLGKRVAYIPGKSTEKNWYTDTIIFMLMPSSVAEESIMEGTDQKAQSGQAENVQQSTAADGEAETGAQMDQDSAEASNESDAEMSDDSQAVAADEEKSEALFLASASEDAEEETEMVSANVLFLSADAELKDQTAVDNTTSLEDGTYTLSEDQFAFIGGTGKLKITCSQVKVESGKAYAELNISSKSIGQVQWAGGYQDGTSIQNIEVPVKLNVENDIALLTTAMSEPHLVSYKIKVTLEEKTADDDQKDKPDEKEKTALADGTYTVDPEKIELANGTRMFNIVSCKLVVKDGKMTATMALHGKGLDAMYPGTAKQAETAAASSLVKADTSGEYWTFTLPVAALDEVVNYAARSKSYYEQSLSGTKPADKAIWYDKQLIFHSEGITAGDSTKDSGSKDNGSGKNSDSNKNSGSNKNNDSNKNNNSNKNNGGNKNNGSNNSNTGSGSGNSTGGGSNSGKNGTGSGGKAGGGSSATSNVGSKSTSAVDSATGLADGDYTPDSFSWSGGTGKLSISCDKISVKDGKTYATIVFTSSHIVYVLASGSKYTPAAQDSSSSTYEVPVQLNTNNKIVACTTAMSVPHEIEYTLFIGLEAAKNGSTASASGVRSAGAGGGAASGSGATVEAEDGSSLEVLENAPQIPMLTYEGTKINDAAENFRIHYYNDGWRVLEISLADAEAEDKWTASAPEKSDSEQTEEAEESQQQADEEEGSAVKKDASLYAGNVLQYLIVPEGADLPAGIDKQMILVQKPLADLYVDSDSALKMLEKLDLISAIRAVGIEEGDSSSISDSLQKAIVEQQIASGPVYDDKSVFKTILSRQISMAIVPGDVLAKPETEENESAIQKLGDQYALLGCSMLVDRTMDEKTEAAQYEWLKVYGLLLDAEDAAGEAYDSAIAALGK